MPNLSFHVEICEDLWVPIPPSTYGAMAGATVLVNLSASNITVGKSDYRHMLCAAHSARTISAYVYTAAGFGESTTDLAWDGQAIIHENGDLVAEGERFASEEQLVLADIDLDRLVADRSSMSSWGDSLHDHRRRLQRIRRIPFELGVPGRAVALRRAIERFPYVPSNPRSRNERCEEVYRIQVAGLETRLRATGIERIVIAISGGLDSTHALIVAARALDRLGLPADQRARLHDARLRHQRHHARQRPRADGGARRQRGRDRHPPGLGGDVARRSGIRLVPANRSTT